MEDTIDGKVFVVRVDRVEPHPNADRLDLAHVKGWQCVVRKGETKPGDLVVYIPIDSVLPNDLESELFPVDSKITLSNHRIKTIKIRKAISQGMVISAHDPVIRQRIEEPVEGLDVTGMLGITHYEPPSTGSPQGSTQGQSKRINHFFPEYTKISHFKNYPNLFSEGEQVVVTEKIHGTNFRAGWAPMEADTFWKRVKKFFGYLPEWEFLYGSHRVQYNNGAKSFLGYYKTNVYRSMVEKYDLETRIPKGYVVYGEIYGDGIQAGYNYGLKDGAHDVVLFDVLCTNIQHEQIFLDWANVELLSVMIGVPTVPVIFRGPWDAAKVSIWESGPSLVGLSAMSFSQAHREGIVVKPMVEETCWIGRKMLRSINPEYLLGNQTDFH